MAGENQRATKPKRKKKRSRVYVVLGGEGLWSALHVHPLQPHLKFFSSCAHPNPLLPHSSHVLPKHLSSLHSSSKLRHLQPQQLQPYSCSDNRSKNRLCIKQQQQDAQRHCPDNIATNQVLCTYNVPFWSI